MDREILRSLAGQIAEIAALDIQKKNADMYRALNSLRPVRPVVLIDELPWNQLEISGELELKCEDEYLRSVERDMRRILYKWNHCRCDMIVEPFWRVNIAPVFWRFGEGGNPGHRPGQQHNFASLRGSDYMHG